MTAAEDYAHLRHLLDRPPPAKLRHLRAIADADPQLAVYTTGDEGVPAADRPGFGAFVGMGRSEHRRCLRGHRG
ncbi:hypothetical protein [Streptomyces palmae]|uniref:hypothetical protein n=1 Tax=Streptomyces palmae TaxID=1701085 RepID=UPI001432D991|nr:hypothetical protein [Streptomyces palmae]